MTWIERTDREPSKDGWYLVCDMETAPYLPDRAEFEGAKWSPVQGDEAFVITHWMELPPPPFEVDWDDETE